MVLKVIGLLVLMVAAYCQNQHGLTFTLQTLVTQNTPLRVEYDENRNIERHENTDSFQTVKQQTSLGNGHEIYNEDPKRKYLLSKDPAPVYESLEPVRAPVALKIVKQIVPHASTHHRVVQLVQQKPLKPQVVPVAPIAPVIHQATLTPVIQKEVAIPDLHSPVEHHSVLVPHHVPIENQIVQVDHEAPVQDRVIEIAHVPEYQEGVHQIENDYKVSKYEDFKVHNQHNLDYFAYPKYEFSYEVKDPHTHDVKYQHESRDGDVVKGTYSLREPNGSIRIVNYSSDKNEGFNAEVSHKGHTEHIQPHHHY